MENLNPIQIIQDIKTSLTENGYFIHNEENPNFYNPTQYIHDLERLNIDPPVTPLKEGEIGVGRVSDIMNIGVEHIATIAIEADTVHFYPGNGFRVLNENSSTLSLNEIQELFLSKFEEFVQNLQRVPGGIFVVKHRDRF